MAYIARLAIDTQREIFKAVVYHPKLTPQREGIATKKNWAKPIEVIHQPAGTYP
ncbi:hypothetical protein J6V86_02635 [bacterium]|nr:hypothetical protein [bacterium]